MYKSMRDIPNPYTATEEIKHEKMFVGRNKEIDKVLSAVDDYLKSGIKKNFLIIGGKSIGKSSFLNIIKQKLITKQLLAVPVVINKNKITSALTFFKELIDNIFEYGSSVDLLNKKKEDEKYTQKEIWESLTTYGVHEGSSKYDRSILLAEVISNAIKLNRYDIPISEVSLLKDFKYISSEIKKSEYKGMVILLDEFQMLEENDAIIQLIQRIMDEVPDLLFVLSGNNLIATESFEKIIRKSETIHLKLFQPHQVRDFIYKPLMYYGFTREEINEVLDHDSFSYFFRKKEQNPYYINLILHYVFDKYKRNISDKLRLDPDVTSEVISQLKLNSPYHEKIAAQLNASSKEQLEALTRLFPFQNINLNEIVMLNLAFDNYDDKDYQNILRKVVNDIELIKPLNLFEFSVPNELTNKNLAEYDPITKNMAAEIKYKFIGDNIDELYMSHIIQTALKEDLILDTHLSVIEQLSFRLNDYIQKKISKMTIMENKAWSVSHFSIAEKPEEVNLSSKILTEKIEIIENTSNKDNVTDSDYEQIQKATKDTSLVIMPMFSQIAGSDKSLYYLFVKAKVRHKIINYENFFFCTGCIEDYTPLYLGDSLTNETFALYNIEILDSVLIKVKPEVVVFLQSIDLMELDVMLLRYLINNEYEKAIHILEIKKNFESDDNTSINNIGFAYMCDCQYELAKKHFDQVKNKEYVTFINMAYLSYRLNENTCDALLKKAEKSYKQLSPELNLKVIHQILIPNNERENLPKNYDLAYDVEADLIIQGNKAILASFNNQNHGFGFINKVKLKNDMDKYYKQRYTYYLYYNLGQKEKALEIMNQVVNENYETIYNE
jgi:hypothetical protein